MSELGSAPSSRLEVGRFVLDTTHRSLTHGGEPVPISATLFDMLLYLVRHPDRIVTKSELLDAVWPTKTVEEANVSQTVFALRYAHAYFGDGNRDGSIDGGVKFPGEPPSDYRAFIYMAVCIGSTFQVSDFNILTNDYRSLVTTHAVISFAFNVAVLALGVNMVAAVIGQ